MTKPARPANLPQWQQLPDDNRIRLSRCLFFIVLKQIGGISDEPGKNKSASFEAQSGNLCPSVVAASSKSPRGKYVFIKLKQD